MEQAKAAGLLPFFFRDAIVKADEYNAEIKSRIKFIAALMDDEYGFSLDSWTFGGEIRPDGTYVSEFDDDPDMQPISEWEAGRDYADKWGDIKLFIYNYAILALYDTTTGKYTIGRMD